MSPSLGLHYAPHLDAVLLVKLEAAARRCGLPLGQVELLGQDETVARGFVAACEQGTTSRFLAGIDWDRLEHLYQSHKIEMPRVLRRPSERSIIRGGA